MTTEMLTAVDLDDPLPFACHPAVPCFNHCCRDLHQALTPYDILRLSRYLKLTSVDFRRRYTDTSVGPATGLPIVTLRFAQNRQQACPFVTVSGCRVYPARPASCRLYPLARAVRRDRRDGCIQVAYAVLREPHCRGFNSAGRQTVGEWIATQELTLDFTLNDALLEFIALKNRLRPGPLSPAHQALLTMAWYDLDLLKKEYAAGRLAPSCAAAPPADADDVAWLQWAMAWIQHELFGSAA